MPRNAALARSPSTPLPGGSSVRSTISTSGQARLAPGTLTTSTPASSASQLGTLPTMSNQNRSTAARVRSRSRAWRVGVWRSFMARLPSSTRTARPSPAIGQRAVRWVPTSRVPGWPHACDQALVTNRSPWSGSTSTTASPRSSRIPEARPSTSVPVGATTSTDLPAASSGAAVAASNAEGSDGANAYVLRTRSPAAALLARSSSAPRREFAHRLSLAR